MAERLRSHSSRILLFFLANLLLGCGTLESKRIEQLRNQRGWGGRSSGDAQVENYVAFGDAIQFFLPDTVFAQPGAAGLFLLAQPQPIAIDGTIFVPTIGAIPVLGLTERELGTLVSSQLETLYTFPIKVQARIVNNAKSYFVIGEFAGSFGGSKRRILPGDYTILDVMADNPITPLANIGRITLIRPDPKNPLVFTVNTREMWLEGNTTWNFAIKEHDIIYAPPTVLGALARFLEKLLLPAQILVNAIFQGLFIRDAYRAVENDEPFYGYGYYGGYSGGYGRVY